MKHHIPRKKKEITKQLLNNPCSSIIAISLGFPLGVILSFQNIEFSIPYRYVLVVCPILSIIIVLTAIQAIKRGTKNLWVELKNQFLLYHAVLFTATVLSILFLVRPWHVSYTNSQIFTLALGFAIGGSITTILLIVQYFMQWKMYRQGIFSNMVSGGPYIISLVLLGTNFLLGGVASLPIFFFWTKEIIELKPDGITAATFLVLLTTCSFFLLGLLICRIQLSKQFTISGTGSTPNVSNVGYSEGSSYQSNDSGDSDSDFG
ncbi:MAG: hypothetical protein AAF518_03955 [Spirochaetota bacterium]